VERKRNDVVPALVQLVNDHTVDSLGLNPGALHALWTLHGLGALTPNSDAMRAAQAALHHPAASLRRAALQLLPRNEQLMQDIFAAGILPDRSSPTPVEYTVPTGILQDADAHVRLEALLALSDLPAAPRAATAVLDLIVHPENARDPWIPDAAAMAAVKQGGPNFVRDVLARRLPAGDSVAMRGIARTVNKVARVYAAQENTATVVSIIENIPQASPVIAIGLLNGIALGWPEEKPPQLSDVQRAALATAARGAAGEVSEAFGRVAARWNLPDVFKGQ
jgi:hypothetical protein